MEEITTFFIYTPWRTSHKFPVNSDGLVEYRDRLTTPREIYENFEVDYPMFEIVRAEVCRRVNNPDPEAERPYMWEDVERFQ